VTIPSLIHPLLDPLASIDVNVAITNKAFEFVSSESNLWDHEVRYFNTVHTWLPVISQDRYYQRLSSFFDGQNPGFSVLTLSVILISTVPQFSGTGTLISLYLSFKSFIGVLEGMGINSLDFVTSQIAGSGLRGWPWVPPGRKYLHWGGNQSCNGQGAWRKAVCGSIGVYGGDGQ
jgi:hypothetical protein